MSVYGTLFPILHRECTTNLFFTPAGASDARRCSALCKDTSFCGTVAIPEEYLKVCRGGGVEGGRMRGRKGRMEEGGGGWREGGGRGGGIELRGGERGSEL